VQQHLLGVGKGELGTLELVLSGEPAVGLAHIGRKPDRRFSAARAGKYIAFEGRSKRAVR
jgi:hypothetical protein